MLKFLNSIRFWKIYGLAATATIVVSVLVPQVYAVIGSVVYSVKDYAILTAVNVYTSSFVQSNLLALSVAAAVAGTFLAYRGWITWRRSNAQAVNKENADVRGPVQSPNTLNLIADTTALQKKEETT